MTTEEIVKSLRACGRNCCDCGAEVGEFATAERAIEAWNRRV